MATNSWLLGDIVSLAVILSMKISIGEFVYNFLLQMKGMSVAVVK